MQPKIIINFFISIGITVGFVLAVLLLATTGKKSQSAIPIEEKSAPAPVIVGERIFAGRSNFTFSYGVQYTITEAPVDDYASLEQAEVDMKNFLSLYAAEPEKDVEPSALTSADGIKLRIWIYSRFNKTLDEWIQEIEKKEKLDIVDLTDQTINSRRIARVIFDNEEKLEYSGAYFMVLDNHAIKIDILPDNPAVLWHFDRPATTVEQILSSFSIGK